MKKLYLLSVIILFINSTYAQIPQALTYQAVARNASGSAIINSNLSIRVSIKDVNATGPTLYSETHSVTTNQFGLFTVAIGTGLIQSGVFANINWATGSKFMKVEMDVTGGSSYIDMGTSQMLSVPYALFAGSVVGGSGGDDWGAQTAIANSTLTGDGTNSNPLGLAQQGAASGQTLKWNGSQWVPANDLVGTGGDNWGAQSVVTNSTLTGAGTFASPIGIAQQGATLGQTLKWNGAAWAPSNDLDNDAQTLGIAGNILTISNGNSITLPVAINYTAGTGINILGNIISNTGDISNSNELQTLSISGSQLTISGGNTVAIPIGTNYSAGTGIDITGNTISNSSPDQVVSITGTGGASVTGFYPNFNVNSTDAQTLSLNGSLLTILNGNSVTLPIGTTYTSGSGIGIIGNVISNTQPDQIVNITGGGATNVSGIYPNFTISSSDNNTTYSNGSGIDLTGTVFSLNAITDQTLDGNGSAGAPLKIAQQSAITGQTLKWNGTSWIPANDLDNDSQTLSINGSIISISSGNSINLPAPVSYTAGTGIGIAGTVITNTSPDQVVSLIGTGGTNVLGSYPNFTINSIDNDVQSLSLNGNNLSISNGNTLSLPLGTTYSAGTGIGIIGTIISNSAPDQIVTLVGTGATTITGAYPNFTINSVDTDTDTQTLSLNGNILAISNGNNVTLTTGSNYTAGSGISLTGTTFSNNAITDFTLSGNGTAGTPLKIAQQGATTGQVLQWDGTTWLPSTIAAAGAFGQSTTSVFGTLAITQTPTSAFTLVPGLTQTINIPAGYSIFITSGGGISTSSVLGTGYSVADIVLAIDGALNAAGGGYQRLTALNNGGLIGNFSYWALHLSPVLTPGLHTIEVRAAGANNGGSNFSVSGDATSVLQGELTITLIKN